MQAVGKITIVLRNQLMMEEFLSSPLYPNPIFTKKETTSHKTGYLLTAGFKQILSLYTDTCSKASGYYGWTHAPGYRIHF